MDALQRYCQEHKQLNEKLYHAFCWFHSHPELSYEEHETTEKIREFLTKEGIEILPGGPPTGLAAVIRGEQEGPVQALRCDSYLSYRHFLSFQELLRLFLLNESQFLPIS